ncbi:MAG: ATP phosphoribosyltransferase, partial [Cyanobacteria bacterium J06639_16]
MLTIALPKGALLKESIERFKAIGLDFSAFLDKSNRQLQIT